MKIAFEKYQGAGNDFVIIDNRESTYIKISTKHIKTLCDRNFGVGADGLIMINSSDTVDFEMQYYNSDGQQSSMCGNGGRCAVAFAKHKNIIEDTTTFSAIDGLHNAMVNSNETVTLNMVDVSSFSRDKNAVITDTGSPHYVLKVSNVAVIDVFKEGAAVRNSETYSPDGLNVNFVQSIGSAQYKIRTYERGVENETLACGTGAVAAALVMHYTNETTATQIEMKALGGDLVIDFKVNKNKYTDIRLTGPAKAVFSGIFHI